jgi:hypothetical protein
LLPSSTPPTKPATVPRPATTVAAPDPPELPFEDPEAPPLLERALELDPFWLRAREFELLAFELLALELLARAPELFARACEPPDLLRAVFALPPFEALAPFLAFEPEDDAREDPADEDFRWPWDDVFPLLEERALAVAILALPSSSYFPCSREQITLFEEGANTMGRAAQRLAYRPPSQARR